MRWSATRHVDARRQRPAAAIVAAAALAAGLAACTPQSSGAGVIDQGYVSSDGSVRQWTVSERGEPVTVTGVDLAGNPVDTADWAGDVVVLNTWYSTCGPCRAEAPDLVALANNRAEDGVRVLGINVQDSPATGQAFERRYSVPYPSIADADARVVQNLSAVVPLRAVPTTVVLDQEHKVAARILGRADPSTLASIIDEVLAE